jgi:hypothetical protein
LFAKIFLHFGNWECSSLGFLLHAGSKQELTQIKIELEKKETKEELTKMRSDVRKTFSELSTNLNGISI